MTISWRRARARITSSIGIKRLFGYPNVAKPKRNMLGHWIMPNWLELSTSPCPGATPAWKRKKGSWKNALPSCSSWLRKLTDLPDLPEREEKLASDLPTKWVQDANPNAALP